MKIRDIFYCENFPSITGLPDGFDDARIDWDERLKLAEMGMDSIDSIREDREKLTKEGYHLAVAGGFIGTWPTEPELLSGPDSHGGFRIGFKHSPDAYLCAVCRSPIRMKT
jgi:hypothetical protein